MSEVKRIRLTREIILGGKHVEEGSVHEVSRALAHRLVGEGSAEHHVEDGDEPETGPTTVNRIEHPQHGDPAPRQIAPAASKVKEKEKK